MNKPCNVCVGWDPGDLFNCVYCKGTGWTEFNFSPGDAFVLTRGYFERLAEYMPDHGILFDRYHYIGKTLILGKPDTHSSSRNYLSLPSNRSRRQGLTQYPVWTGRVERNGEYSGVAWIWFPDLIADPVLADPEGDDLGEWDLL